MAEAKLGKGKKAESSNQEKIVATFQQLRAEQRAIANKISELEGEKREHQIVLEALKDVPADRCCFRMVGGVLVERTVKDVTPALQHNTEQFTALMEKLMVQLEEKGKEINEFRTKHNIRLQGEVPGDRDASDVSSTTSNTQGVLVS